MHETRGAFGQHKAAAQSVVVCMPWIVLRVVILLMKWEGTSLRVIVDRWACSRRCGRCCTVGG